MRACSIVPILPSGGSERVPHRTVLGWTAVHRRSFEEVLRPAFSNLKVVIHDQIAEGDKVTTRKTISGTHSGTLLGIPATGRDLTITVIDIVRVEGGRYAEHWGLNTLSNVVATLSKG